MKPTVCVVIVTYNRIECLKRCLNSVKNQDFVPNYIFLYDNASTDGTDLFVKQQLSAELDKNEVSTYFGIPFFYVRSKTNKGGSYGFKTALAEAQKTNSDFYWIMDDDVAPTISCLSTLLRSFSTGVAAVYPHRVGAGFVERIPIKQNLSNPFLGLLKPNEKKYFFQGPIDSTVSVVNFSFEGPLISKEAIKNVGDIDDSYFNQYDDGDYAERIRKFGAILYVGSAVMERQLPIVTQKENFQRVYYTIRNSILFNKKFAKPFVWKNRAITSFNVWFVSALLHGDWKKMKIIWVATRDGWSGKTGEFKFK